MQQLAGELEAGTLEGQDGWRHVYETGEAPTWDVDVAALEKLREMTAEEEPHRADRHKPAPGTVRQHLAGGREHRTGPAGARPDRVSTPTVLGCPLVDRCTHLTIREKTA